MTTRGCEGIERLERRVLLAHVGLDLSFGDAGYAPVDGGAGNDVFITLDDVIDQLFGDGGDDAATADEDDVLISVINA